MKNINFELNKMRINFFHSLLSQLGFRQEKDDMGKKIFSTGKVVISLYEECDSGLGRRFGSLQFMDKIQFSTQAENERSIVLKKILECSELSGVTLWYMGNCDETKRFLEKEGFVIEKFNTFGMSGSNYFYSPVTKEKDNVYLNVNEDESTEYVSVSKFFDIIGHPFFNLMDVFKKSSMLNKNYIKPIQIKYNLIESSLEIVSGFETMLYAIKNCFEFIPINIDCKPNLSHSINYSNKDLYFPIYNRSFLKENFTNNYGFVKFSNVFLLKESEFYSNNRNYNNEERNGRLRNIKKIGYEFNLKNTFQEIVKSCLSYLNVPNYFAIFLSFTAFYYTFASKRLSSYSWYEVAISLSFFILMLVMTSYLFIGEMFFTIRKSDSKHIYFSKSDYKIFDFEIKNMPLIRFFDTKGFNLFLNVIIYVPISLLFIDYTFKSFELFYSKFGEPMDIFFLILYMVLSIGFFNLLSSLTLFVSKSIKYAVLKISYFILSKTKMENLSIILFSDIESHIRKKGALNLSYSFYFNNFSREAFKRISFLSRKIK